MPSLLRFLTVIGVLCGAFVLALQISLERAVHPRDLVRLAYSARYDVGMQVLCLAAFRVPGVPWRYAGLPEAGRIGFALGVAGCVLAALTAVGTALLPALAGCVYTIERKQVAPKADGSWSLAIPANVTAVYVTGPNATASQPAGVKAEKIGDAADGFFKYKIVS